MFRKSLSIPKEIKNIPNKFRGMFLMDEIVNSFEEDESNKEVVITKLSSQGIEFTEYHNVVAKKGEDQEILTNFYYLDFPTMTIILYNSNVTPIKTILEKMKSFRKEFRIEESVSLDPYMNEFYENRVIIKEDYPKERLERFCLLIEVIIQNLVNKTEAKKVKVTA